MASTTAESSREPPQGSGSGALRKRRWIYAITNALLVAVVVSVAVDAASSSLDVWGVTKGEARDRRPGLELVVRYPTVTRPGLASPFAVTVVRDGGFDNDIELAFSAAYFKLWDVNGLFPEPKEWRSEGDRLVFVFDPPDGGNRFEWFYEARIEPAQQSGRHGYVAVLEAGEPAAIARFRTRVMP